MNDLSLVTVLCEAPNYKQVEKINSKTNASNIPSQLLSCLFRRAVTKLLGMADLISVLPIFTIVCSWNHRNQARPRAPVGRAPVVMMMTEYTPFNDEDRFKPFVQQRCIVGGA